MMPMGPAPVISTSSPTPRRRGRCESRCRGGRRWRRPPEATLVRCRHTLRMAEHDVLGEAARALHAQAERVRAEMPAAGEAAAAAAADDVTLAAHDLAGPKVRDIGAHLDDLADELVPDDQGHRNRGPGPVVPLVDVQVGSADAGHQDADEHVVDPGFGSGSSPSQMPGSRRDLINAFMGSSLSGDAEFPASLREGHRRGFEHRARVAGAHLCVSAPCPSGRPGRKSRSHTRRARAGGRPCARRARRRPA